VWVRSKQACLIFIGLTLLLAGGYALRRTALAQDGSTWLASSAPDLNKVVDLPDDTIPDRNNVDCSKEIYTPLADGQRTVCTFASPIGTLTTDGHIRTAADKLAVLQAGSTQSVFLPTPTDAIAVSSIPAPGIGNYVGIYRHLTKASLQLTTYYNTEPFYNVTAAPDEMLRDPLTRQLLEVDAGSMAFSANGEWMVVDLPHRGLLRVNMADLSTQLFASSLEPEWYLGLSGVSLAVSNDGRYAAANTDIFGTGNVTIYDLATCDDQLANADTARTYCSSKNMQESMRYAGSALSYPVHIRFVSDDSVAFYARYGIVSATSYKAASFVLTAPGQVQHKIGLLGFGDSYISGQGAYSYRQETDTANNNCHVSLLSYPYLLGVQYFNTYDSAACSGAITSNIVGSNLGYEGQLGDGIPESKRDKSNISISRSSLQPTNQKQCCCRWAGMISALAKSCAHAWQTKAAALATIATRSELNYSTRSIVPTPS
jgi:hypothetical protein